MPDSAVMPAFRHTGKRRPSSWTRLVLATLAAACLSCGAAHSELMTPAAGPPSGPVPSKAVVLFAADIELDLGASQVLTIYDENKHFLGELFEHSMFEAELAPGKHGFAAIDVRGARPDEQLPCGQAFTAELEAGKIYLAWIRFGEPERQNEQLYILPLRWIFARPDSKLLNPRDVMMVRRKRPTVPETKPFLQSDRVRGQALLDGLGGRLCVPPAEPGAKGVDLPASFGFDQLPR